MAALDKHRILISGPFNHRVMKDLQGKGFEVVRCPANVSTDELTRGLSGADGYILGGNEKLTADVVNRAEKLGVIVFLGEQPETFIGPDVKALLDDRGIPLEIIEAVSTNAVAEFTCGLILAALRRIPFLVRAVQDGEWPTYTGEELAGKTLGICGMGKIGYVVVKRLSGFDLSQVLYYDIVRAERAEEDFRVKRVNLDQLFAESDIVSIHTPLMPETRGMIGEDLLRRMRPAAVLVNTARPQVVDPDALSRILEERRIACAAFDGYYFEGPEFIECARKEDPYGLLYMRDRFFVTSHQGFNAQNSIRQSSEKAAGRIVGFFAESRRRTRAA